MLKLQRRWSAEEDAILQAETELQCAANNGEVKSWRDIAKKIPGRTNKDCRKRYCNSVGHDLKKGPWTEEEDALLEGYVAEFGPSWAAVSEKMKTRSADQCAKRWQHCLDPKLDHSSWTAKEDNRLLLAVKNHGTAWKLIQTQCFPQRSANNVKNQYTILKRREMTEKLGEKAPPSPEKPHGDGERRSQSPPASQGDVSMADLLDMDQDMAEFPGFMNFDILADPDSMFEDFDTTNLMDPYILDAGDRPSQQYHDGLALFAPISRQGPTDRTQGFGAQQLQIQGVNKDAGSEGMEESEDIYDAAGGQTLNPGTTSSASVYSMNTPHFTEMQYLQEWEAKDVKSAGGHRSSFASQDSAGSRTTITLYDPDPKVTVAIMDILIKSKSNMTFDMSG